MQSSQPIGCRACGSNGSGAADNDISPTALNSSALPWNTSRDPALCGDPCGHCTVSGFNRRSQTGTPALLNSQPRSCQTCSNASDSFSPSRFGILCLHSTSVAPPRRPSEGTIRLEGKASEPRRGHVHSRLLRRCCSGLGRDRCGWGTVLGRHARVGRCQLLSGTARAPGMADAERPVGRSRRRVRSRGSVKRARRWRPAATGAASLAWRRSNGSTGLAACRIRTAPPRNQPPDSRLCSNQPGAVEQVRDQTAIA